MNIDTSIGQFEFIVTGPPRSGTLWMANFLSYGRESFCWHEPFASNKIFHSNETKGKLVGASCSTFAVERISELKTYQERGGRVIYLSKDYDTCVKSIGDKMANTQHGNISKEDFDKAYKSSYSLAFSLFPKRFDISNRNNTIDRLRYLWMFAFKDRITFDYDWACHCLLSNVQLQQISY
jgi:hypothetical protein